MADENIEKIVDILEVIEAISSFKKFSQPEIDSVKERKATERGKFLKKNYFG